MQNENKKRYLDGCFSGDWTDANICESGKSQKAYNYERKSLETLLEELEEIKRNIEQILEKERFLEDLMRIYKEDMATR